ncbi:DegT/DnrJ/EryC1/StrS family aminotransferase, partial [Alphaproteobacteria bacterium]|nr:DegT/DnrJ/EryC1/StrS family aminotransferase [Alphaproteobacteria bacterium]
MKDTWRFDGNELSYLKDVLVSGEVAGMSGSANQTFEKKFAKLVGANYGVTFNSGTSTLHAALHALGVARGDEVIIPALTVIANFDVIIAQGAIPVFADVQLDTFNIDPIDVKRKINSKTKAIMIVPLYGAPCDYDAFLEISRSTGVPIINDAAQAPLAIYKGRPIASLFDICSFSFDATKHMTTGDGGMITTLSDETARQIRKFGCLGYRALEAGDGRVRTNKDIFQNPNYSRHD